MLTPALTLACVVGLTALQPALDGGTHRGLALTVPRSHRGIKDRLERTIGADAMKPGFHRCSGAATSGQWVD